MMKLHSFHVSLLGVAIGLGCLRASEPSSPSSDEKTVPLTGLAERCMKMLKIQIDLHDATKQLHKSIQANPDKKPSPRDKEAATTLSIKQQAMIDEASAILDLLNKDGTAVAFTEVFEELRGEMKRIQANLEKGDAGPATLKIEASIVETLKDLVRAIVIPG
jgi:hypothetical protein